MSKNQPPAHVRRILSLLDHVEERGSNSWQARCPYHDDKRPSLSINIGGDGKVLLHCHAGCETKDILKVLGLDFVDLFPSRTVRTKTSRGKIVAKYDYCDATGELALQVVRYGPKQFRQRRRGPDGKALFLPLFACIRCA